MKSHKELYKKYNSVLELMFTDRQLNKIIAMTKSHDETDPDIKRIVRKCHKLLEHEDTLFIEGETNGN